MYCCHCGTKLPEHAKFCPACGNVVNVEPENAVPASGEESPCQVEERAVPVEKPEKDKKRIPKPHKERTQNEKRSMDPANRKKLFLIGGSLIGVLAVIGIVMVFLANQVVASIPDPEVFFGISGKWEDMGDSRFFQFETEKDPSEAVQAYVELLESSRYPFYLGYSSDWDDLRYEMHYNGDKKLYFASSSDDISIIDYGNDYYGDKDIYVVRVLICNYAHFELISAEVYDWSGASVAAEKKDEEDTKDTVTIPNPAVYLGMDPLSGTENGTSPRFESEKDLLTAMDAYIELLCSEYGFINDGCDKNDHALECDLLHGEGGPDVNIAAGDRGADADPSERYFVFFDWDEEIEPVAAETYDWSAAVVENGSAAEPGTGTKTLLADKLSQDPLTYAVDSSSVYIQNPGDYFGSDLTLKKRSDDNDYTIWEFRGDYSVMEDYVNLLCGGNYNLTLADNYYQAYSSSRISSGGTFFAWLIDYTGTGSIRQTTSVPYIDGKSANIGIYGLDSGSTMKMYLYIPEDMEIVDLGLRHSGGDVSTGISSGTSATAGLYRMPDGSFETSDGRLNTQLGQATVLRDGEICTTPATMVHKSEKSELWVKDFYRNEAIFFCFPKNSVVSGDIFTKEDILKDASWANSNWSFSSADDFGGYRWTLCFGVGHDGDFILPLNGSANQFRNLLVRVMYWEQDVEAVYYIYSEFDSAPYVFEALCAVDLTQATDADAAQPVSLGSGEQPCGTCGGSGSCRDCGGTGKVTKWVTGTRSYVEQNCTSCYIPGKCRDCGGSGKV